MSKKLLFIILIIIVVFAFVGYQFISKMQLGAVSGLKVVSSPSADVFLNDKLIGKTPYEGKHAAGEYVLKLIPEDTSSQVVSWQGKIVLQPSLLTYVKRELGSSELTSSGDMLFLEKISGSEAQIVVLSSPDASKVIIDGQEKGITPLVLRDVASGENDVAISSPGFVGRTVRVQTMQGYKVTVNFQMALSGDSALVEGVTPTPGGEITQGDKQYVLIKDTPTGFLRVRSGPSTSAKEIGRVKPGEKSVFIEEQEGWYKINYEEGKEGWISNRYAEKVK
ncbi:hypothetical protein COV53_06945 [Candidatus Gottesmanbacteria bacterium CG11_big_fil_rev_8_21_14_0_20_37_11]|uniref:SH3b domain-containing protein n=3 Tax=Candidatus Gottesmaniibacteriota TaxID=1752720 RepID=A0A2M7RRN5_9BACT|nr:MAG: hypothetical protein AUJ73_01635 [Candidatus Gottesmanbacteria bacterium CG1_02_37_22]PIP32181.1 MAG: hypothetical protein COX23_06125 [Candidatus Gottesmanbacteria bacterium CG23_combo_of_CG06-09_8_20_14_all_37_19]PIR07693.1 MAG: hypothetical protein COV53_06945 [Candidatus Gottesmanbacteria bacterium CG11_big_fil_rev_8_21_14_0_20_37_11]PIZ02968.1 MAG: hypothetical protein COY59_01930 [Candidatus Gottesmanbacteria bacterium CG_4_10_14_0_8_um_filter_37_24]